MRRDISDRTIPRDVVVLDVPPREQLELVSFEEQPAAVLLGLGHLRSAFIHTVVPSLDEPRLPELLVLVHFLEREDVGVETRELVDEVAAARLPPAR